MHIVRSIEALHLPASACAIGMFDGIHAGHRMVLEHALREARLRSIPSVVVSFADHPQFLISQTPTQLLSSLEERLKRFETLGFDYALILEFNDWLKNLSAEDFIDRILQGHLGAKSVTVGYDHRFGKNRAGDGDMLKRAGQAQGFSVQIIEPVRTQLESPDDTAQGGGQIVSSTLIRKPLAYGDITQANRLLSHSYSLTSIVGTGLQRGRQLGFPTANLAIDPHRLIPGNGTYGGYAILKGRDAPDASESYSEELYPAVCNIGLSPTFGDQTRKRVEVHLLGYTGPDFYGHSLEMVFEQKIRDEQTFSSIEALVAQISKDCRLVRNAQTHLSETGSRT